MDKGGQTKVRFRGTVRAVEVRSDVWRYKLDNRTHSHKGYNVFLAGEVDGVEREFSLAISEKQQQKWGFRIGDVASGTAWTKLHPKREYADFYRVAAVRFETYDPDPHESTSAPWTGEVPSLDVYRTRQCRMLDTRRYKGKCRSCKWAAMANVVIEYDFGVSQRLRFESFCYGPKSCPLYAMGRPRSVPYKGISGLLDEGWLDEDMTAHRDWDE